MDHDTHDMPEQTLDQTLEQTIEAFSMTLENAKSLLQESVHHANALDSLEAAIMRRLDDCESLVRWAVVSVQGNDLHCEGAYLKSSSAA